jgi:hypothetical protein
MIAVLVAKPAGERNAAAGSFGGIGWCVKVQRGTAAPAVRIPCHCLANRRHSVLPVP